MVKLLLWNVDLTPDLSFTSPFRNSKKRYPEIAKVINEYDVVILNECFLYRDSLLKLVEHKFVYVSPRPWYKIFDSGVVILSKYPFSEMTYHSFTHNSYWDRFISKGVSKVTININGKLVDIYGTHMQQYNDKSAHEAREAQVSEIVDFVNATRGDGRDIILVGDLNMGPVKDKNFNSYPIHYSDKEDAKKRNAQYEMLVNALNLTNFVAEEDICHLLHSGPHLEIERVDIPDYKLSDTGAYCLEIA